MADSFLSYHEGEKIEFKECWSDGIKKDILAFANSGGGKLFLGVKDHGEIVGLKDPDEEIRKLTNWVRDSVKPDLSLFIHYEIFQEKEKRYVCANVSRGTNRPYYLAAKGLRPEGVFVRQGSSSVPATDSAIRNMIKATDGDRYEQMRSLNQALIFKHAEKEFAKRELSFNRQDEVTLKLKTIDGVYTNLGLLLSDQCEHSVKVAVIDGKNEFQFRDRKEFTGSLFLQLNEIYDYLEMRNQTKSSFQQLLRIDRRDYPEVAIREVLLNLLVHRDYSLSASALITLYEDRMEFVSVGGLPEGVELEDILLGLSVCRNPNLASVFYRLQLIEAYGTGIRKMMNSYANSRRKPTIETTTNAFKITLPNLNNHDIPEDVVTFKEHQNVYTTEGFEEEKTIMQFIREHGRITRVEVEKKLGVAPATAYRRLRALIEHGRIVSKGRGKRTVYQLSQSEAQE